MKICKLCEVCRARTLVWKLIHGCYQIHSLTSPFYVPCCTINTKGRQVNKLLFRIFLTPAKLGICQLLGHANTMGTAGSSQDASHQFQMNINEIRIKREEYHEKKGGKENKC